MRRISIAVLALLAMAGVAWAAGNPFDPNGSFSQVYAVLMDMSGNVLGGTAHPIIVQTTSTQSAPASTGNDQTLTLTSSASSPTIPTGTTTVDIYPLGTNGTSGNCLFFRADGTAPVATGGSGLASQQIELGYNLSVPGLQFIAASGATCAVTLKYYK